MCQVFAPLGTEPLTSDDQIQSISYRVYHRNTLAVEATGTIPTSGVVHPLRTDRRWQYGAPGWNVEVWVPGSAFAVAGPMVVEVTLWLAGDTPLPITEHVPVTVLPTPD